MSIRTAIGILLSSIIIACISSFVLAFALSFAWEHIAWEFNLPTFNYWVYFTLIFTIRGLCKPFNLEIKEI